jgi:hypothetical protein
MGWNLLRKEEASSYGIMENGNWAGPKIRYPYGFKGEVKDSVGKSIILDL